MAAATASTERQFTAFACHEAKGPIQEWKYTPLPLAEGDVEINIAACGVCHSDLHQVNNDWKGAQYPLVCGHEIIGEVAAVGSAVTHLRVGQRVGYTPQSKNCGKCVNCEKGNQQYCFDKQFNYSSPTGDARQPYTFGGFAQNVRADASWAFPIPDALPTVEAAPLLCAGLTTWSPFVHAKVKRGDKVGVVGMGGLGHVAVQFGVALGAEVTCISTSADKAEDSKKFGAVGFCNIKNADDRKANSGKFSFLLSTISADGVNWDQYLDLLATDGSMCVVGMPSSMTFSPGSLVFKRASIFGSLLASKEEIVSMLDFCAKHKITALTEAVDMNAEGCNLALKKVHDNTARYRMVLVNRSFTSLNAAAATTTAAPATAAPATTA